MDLFECVFEFINQTKQILYFRISVLTGNTLLKDAFFISISLMF